MGQVFWAQQVGGPRGGSCVQCRGESGNDSSRDGLPWLSGSGACNVIERGAGSAGGAILHFAGGASKPRFNLIGEDREATDVARTSAGTQTRAAATRKMPSRRHLTTTFEESVIATAEFIDAPATT